MRDSARHASKTGFIKLHVRPEYEPAGLLVALNDDDGLVVNAVLLATLAQFVVLC
jgi:hypothetical protein